MKSNNPELVIVGHSSAVTTLAFSADGKTLVSGGCDRRAIVWDIETGTLRRLLRLREGVNDLKLTPDGSTIITEDGQVWNAVTGERLRNSRRHTDPLAISPDGRTHASAIFDSSSNPSFILIADVRTGRKLQRFPCSVPLSIAYSSDGQLFGACGYESHEESTFITTVWNLKTGETHQVLRGQCVSLFAVNLPTVRIGAVSDDGTQFWNAESGDVLLTIAKPDNMSVDMFVRVCLSPAGRVLAVGTGRGDVTVWDVGTGQRLWQTQAHQGWLRTIAFTSSGSTLATAGDDYAIRLWNTLTGEPGRTLGRQRISVEAAAFSADGQAITSLGEDGSARLWRISPLCCERQEANASGVLALGAPRKPDTARNLWKLDATALPAEAELSEGFTVAAISPDGALIALRIAGNIISIWNRDTRKLLPTMQSGQAHWVIPSFSPDNRYFASSSENGYRICVFDILKGKACKELATDETTISLTFSSDARFLAVGYSVGCAVTLWNFHIGRRKRSLQIYDDISALAFSPTGTTLAVGMAYEETIWLKSLARGKKDKRLLGHTDSIRSVDFSPNGTWLATGADDGTVRLWEPESGKLLATFLALPEEEWVIYTPDGDFTGSPGAEKWLLWREGEELVPVDT